MLPEKARSYLLYGLESTPVVIERMLRTAGEISWDRRPEPDRFSLREVLAHLADWEPIWLERMQRIAEEERPALQGYDEGLLAIDHDYAHSDPWQQVERFATGRAALTNYLRSLPPESWDRQGFHSEWSNIDISALAVLVLGHDGYHAEQIARWLA